MSVHSAPLWLKLCDSNTSLMYHEDHPKECALCTPVVETHPSCFRVSGTASHFLPGILCIVQALFTLRFDLTTMSAGTEHAKSVSPECLEKNPKIKAKF